MKAVVITKAGKPEVLQVEERNKPICQNDEVLIEVKAAGVNRPDLYQREGGYPAPAGAPDDIPGLEVAGIVVKVGDAVTCFKAGDKVCALVAGGGYAQYVAAPEIQCLPIPGSLDFLEAASLPETFFTVWSNIMDRGAFKAGESVLVHGGSSGIGITAIQLIKAFGGTVFITAGTNEKCQFCKDLGASLAINYQEEDFEEVIKDQGGVDLVLDMIGGDYTPKHINILKEDGRLVMINAMQNSLSTINMKKMMVKRLLITGSTLRNRSKQFKGAIAQRLLTQVWPKISNKEIKPIVNHVFPFDQAKQAHELMESSKHIGKIVLSFE